MLSCVAALTGCGGEGEVQLPEDPRLEAPGLVHLLDVGPSALQGELERAQVGHAPSARRGLPATLDAIEAARRELAVVLEDARDALELDVPGAVAWSLDVQDRARLGFAARAGMRQSMSALAQVELRLRFEPEDDAPVELWSELYQADSPAGGDWIDVRVDLAAFAGQRGQLVFSAELGPNASRSLPMRAWIGAPYIARERAEPAPPNVLVLSIDTLRRDHLEPWGAAGGASPHIAALAAGGVRCDNAWSSSSWTLPAYASLLTGLPPSAHGAGRDHAQPITEGTPALLALGESERLVERFRRDGYHTQAFHNNVLLGREMGLAQGFDGYLRYGKTARASLAPFEGWLDGLDGRPFFGLVHLMDPHSPYVPPAGFDEELGAFPPSLERAAWEVREEGVPEAERDAFRAHYAAAVRYTDAIVGELLAALDARGLGEDTIVVLHADHGEELWDHGGWYHGHQLHSELVSMPLVFRWPGGLPAGEVYAKSLRDLDVLPTLLELVGLAPPEVGADPVPGRSFAAALRGVPLESAPPPALAEGLLFGPEHAFALTHGRWRLIDTGTGMSDPGSASLYDLRADPGELHDLANEEPGRVAAMQAAAAELRARASARSSVGQAVELGAGAMAELEALGYASANED